MSETTHTAATTRASGPGRLLVAVYALFAVAATGRSTVQILTRFEEAPLAYSLSALAAAVYIAATVALARSGHTSRRVALAACTFELVGVVAVVGDAAAQLELDEAARREQLAVREVSLEHGGAAAGAAVGVAGRQGDLHRCAEDPAQAQAVRDHPLERDRVPRVRPEAARRRSRRAG